MSVTNAAERALHAGRELLIRGEVPASTALTVAEVCRRAGISTSAFYQRFGDARQFHLEAMVRYAHRSIGTDPFMDTRPDPDQTIRLIECVGDGSLAAAEDLVEPFVEARLTIANPQPAAPLLPWLVNPAIRRAHDNFVVGSIGNRVAHYVPVFDQPLYHRHPGSNAQLSVVLAALDQATDRPFFRSRPEMYRTINRGVLLLAFDQALDRSRPIAGTPADPQPWPEPVELEPDPILDAVPLTADQFHHPIDALTLDAVAAEADVAASTVRTQFGDAATFRRELLHDLVAKFANRSSYLTSEIVHRALLDQTPIEEAITRVVLARARELAAQPLFGLAFDPRNEPTPGLAYHVRAMATRLVDSLLEPISLLAAANGIMFLGRREDPVLRGATWAVLVGTAIQIALQPPALRSVVGDEPTLLGLYLARLVIPDSPQFRNLHD